MLSFGEPSPFADTVRDSGAKLIIQVTDLDEARTALHVGADVIVAQGSEAGGHGGRRATLPFVPAVVDLVRPTPVLAAGGIADGRGLAAALVLGAAGALIGTRFEASPEALVPASVTKAILEGSGGDTERSRVLDIARGSSWPHAIRLAPCVTTSSIVGGMERWTRMNWRSRAATLPWSRSGRGREST